MRDFTISIYLELLDSLQEANFQFQTFADYLTSPQNHPVILRHDVDDRKLHSLRFAELQQQKGIRSTYYFRMVPQSFDPAVIQSIAAMGHEIGYHYEDMDFAHGNPKKAIESFERNLETLRNIVPIKTICMHGSPRSKYDNKDIWKHYDYRSYDIIGEPYFDLDFHDIFYLTDTGRRWDGDKVSIRDKVTNYFNLSFNSTQEIIKNIKQQRFPDKVMFNFHPQRWTDDYPLWLAEKYTQQVKNIVKYWVVSSAHK